MLPIPPTQDLAQSWSQHLQRRVIRLLLQHDKPLFRNKFRLFFVGSALPKIPLLMQYDRYIRLQMLSNELFDDIMPRIRRQLSLKTTHTRQVEESPTRGDIDWSRTLEQNSQPGLSPLSFETRLHQRSLETPENLLTVAILLAYRRELHFLLAQNFADEDLSIQERHFLIEADEKAERELAAAYARALIPQARQTNIEVLIEDIMAHLRPGPNAYRSLLEWWRRFRQMNIGKSQAEKNEKAISLMSQREDEHIDAWLYELWIVLEFIHLLTSKDLLQANDTSVATDLLQYTFTWQDRSFRFHYNRQLDVTSGYAVDWDDAPSSRPDYIIERVQPLEVKYLGDVIWREPPILLDAKYYLRGNDPTNTHGPIKKLLGDMTLLGAQVGGLFFPLLPEPQGEQHVTRIIQRTNRQYASEEALSRQVQLYHLEPMMPVELLQARLSAVLNMAAQYLPERPEPTCQGILLDPDTVNAANWTMPTQMVLCPKPHIGAHVFDLVHLETDCMKNPRVCHAMNQPIAVPMVTRVTSLEQLKHQSRRVRLHSEKLLQAEEEAGSDKTEFSQQIQRMDEIDLPEKRNKLAHGRPISREVASTLRRIAVGDHKMPGILRWLAENIDPAR